MPPSPTLADVVVPGDDRFDLWSRVIATRELSTIAEVGVWRGDFAETMFTRCAGISTYYLIDPWRHLDDWNKPANTGNVKFESHYEQVLARTASWADKRVVLRGRTTEVSAQIPDGSLDFAYVDGDHSLRGITIDLMHMWPKIRDGGLIGGDDFTSTVWQHAESFEPTVVFPFAVYFAEAVDAPIEALPGRQFALHKTAGFSFTDHTGRYGDLSLRTAVLTGRAAPDEPAGRRRRGRRVFGH
jgi:Methyltransferase domain